MEFIATSGNLHLEEVVAALIATGVITQDGGQCVRDAALRGVEECHPLEFIAGLGLPGSAGEERLTLDVLTDWLADWCGLERVHIDPLCVDVSRVTAIMSLSYARRYGILCLDASADEIVVATMQPFEVSWLESLQEFVERSVRRVVASGQKPTVSGPFGLPTPKDGPQRQQQASQEDLLHRLWHLHRFGCNQKRKT